MKDGGAIILGDQGVKIREPNVLEKLDILMNRLDVLQGQLFGCLDAINDLSRAMQSTLMDVEQKKVFVREVFKIQLYRTAVLCQTTLEAGQLGASKAFRELLDGEYKSRAKEVKALSFYHRVMRKLERNSLDKEMPDKEFGVRVVKK